MLLNRDRALGIMQEFGIDAMVGTTPVNLTYLSGHSPWLHWVYRLYTAQKFMYQHYALLFRDQGTPPALILPNRDANISYQAQWPSWMEDVYPYGPQANPGDQPPAEAPPEVHQLFKFKQTAREKELRSAGEALVRAFRDRRLTRGVVAIDLEGMDTAPLEYARRELPDLQFREAGELFRYVRAVKTDAEIALLREAAAINWKGFEVLLGAAVPGATELELSRAYRSGAALAGGMPVFCNNACGPWAVSHWEPRQYALKPGDVVYCDAGCTYNYYNSDTNVSAVLGEPTEQHRALFGAMCEGLDAAIAKVRPGVKFSELLSTFREATARSGVIKAPTGFGHAVGLEARDLPMILAPWQTARDSFIELSHDLPLEAGMVFNLEDNVRVAGVGSVAVEDTLLVTPTGVESLLPQERKILTLPA